MVTIRQVSPETRITSLAFTGRRRRSARHHNFFEELRARNAAAAWASLLMGRNMPEKVANQCVNEGSYQTPERLERFRRIVSVNDRRNIPFEFQLIETGIP